MKPFDELQSWPPSPIPNSYWVEPGRILAGEYPGASGREGAARMQALLNAGITSFIDLTAEDELPPYHLDFPSLGIRDVVHRRFAIADHGLPDSSTTMTKIVHAIHTDAAAGRRIYIHCRAGIGRTGMAVGCYLIHRGMEGPRALDRLQELWQRCARSRSWPSIPETEEQVQYVRSFVAANANTAATSAQRCQGALLGLAIGEALGLLSLDPTLRDVAWLSETKRVARLVTGADTAMTRAVAASLAMRRAHDTNDQLQRYLAWTQEPGAQVPVQLKKVLAMWQWSRKANPGSHDPANVDAHTIARTLGAALFKHADAFEAAELAVEVSRTTLQSPVVLDVCRLWAATLVSALRGASKAEVLSMRAARQVLQTRLVKPQLSALLNAQGSRLEPADGAPALVGVALEAFRAADSFEGTLREAVRTSATAGALAGALAGAHHGVQAIPGEWIKALDGGPQLLELAQMFA